MTPEQKIPDDIKNQIEAKASLHLAIVTNDEIIINPKKHKLLVEFAEFGYQLGIAGATSSSTVKELEREVEYWRQLAEAAEKVIDSFPLTIKWDEEDMASHGAVYNYWKKLKHQKS